MADSLTRSRLAQIDTEVDPTNRNAELERIFTRMQRFPGSAPGGSGLTGLGSADAKGRSRQLNENVWAMNQGRRSPLSVRQAPLREFHMNPAEEISGGATGMEGISSEPVQFGPQSSLSLEALRELLRGRR